jgi:hypothetical protein
MSVEVLPYTRREDTFKSEAASPGTTIRYASHDYVRDIESLRIRPARHAKPPKKRQSAEKILRRFEGFLIEDEGEDYRVVFIENGLPVEYYMPSSPLRKAGITASNQPFQVDEVEIESASGRMVVGYSFTPTAKPSDAFNDAIELTDERRRKLNAIFERFGKAKV